jgi:hypothetical protein
MFAAITWDGTISVGTVMQIVVMVGGFVALYIKLSERLARIETQVDPMWREFAERRKAVRRREDTP